MRQSAGESVLDRAPKKRPGRGTNSQLRSFSKQNLRGDLIIAGVVRLLQSDLACRRGAQAGARGTELWRVERVKGFDAELHLHSLVEPESLEQGNIQVGDL